MKAAHLLILAMVVVGVLYVLSLVVGARAHDDEGPSTPEEARTFDVSDSYGWIASLAARFSPKVELEEDSFTVGARSAQNVSMPGGASRFRRLELRVASPRNPEPGDLEVRYRPRASDAADYPEPLTEDSTWPASRSDLPSVTFLVLDGGGTLTLNNRTGRQMRFEVE